MGEDGAITVVGSSVKVTVELIRRMQEAEEATPSAGADLDDASFQEILDAVSQPSLSRDDSPW